MTQTNTTTAAPAAPQVTVGALLATPAYKGRLRELMGDREAAAFASGLLTIVANNPLIQRCEPASVIKAAMVAAQLHLNLSPQLGLAAVVPYGNQAQFQLMWKGYMQLALRSKEFATLSVNEVYEGELRGVNRFTEQYEFGEATGDRVVGYLAYMRLVSGFEKFVYMSAEQVRQHASTYSKSFRAGSGPWASNFDAMARKTVMKRLLTTYAPLLTDIATARTFDEAVVVEGQEGDSPFYIDNQPDAEPRRKAVKADREAEPADVIARSMDANANK